MKISLAKDVLGGVLGRKGKSGAQMSSYSLIWEGRSHRYLLRKHLVLVTLISFMNMCTYSLIYSQKGRVLEQCWRKDLQCCYEKQRSPSTRVTDPGSSRYSRNVPGILYLYWFKSSPGPFALKHPQRYGSVYLVR